IIMFGLKKTNKTISDLDSFLDLLDECVLTYKSGIKNYLEGNKKDFDDNLESITRLRDNTIELRRTIENELYTYSLVTDQRVEIMQLLERLDTIINLLHKNLWQYEIEIPFFPSELNVDFLKLVEVTGLAVEGTIQASHDYFKAPRFVGEKTHRIYFFEKEVSKLAQSIKRRVFHEMDNFKLSQKFHLRYFTLHVEELAEEAVRVADHLSIMVIKLNN
ncbi:MAG: DUF47 family protein, partial [Muribaculaceae bacterium]|nr:DUF47 family protein [Muribaculaceae bacterium]